MPDENRKLTDPEQEIHKEYAQALRTRGFCILDDASSSQTQLFNCINQKTLPLSFLTNDFPRWRLKNEKQCEEFRVGLVLAFLPHVVGSRFIPKAPRLIEEQQTGCTFVNTYRPYKPEISDAEVSPLFHDFFCRLFPDPQERRIVLQWLAHIFQHPEQRPSWHLLFTSDTGTGKGFLVQEILHPLLRHTTVVSDYSQVMGRFSGVLANNLLVLIDDAKAKTEATQTQLKSLLSEERAYVEKKHGDAGMVDTYTRFILASNEHRPLWLDASERRWYVTARMVHRHDRKETAAFIQMLADWLALPGSLDRVYNWFMAYDLTGFNPKCVPDSAGLAAMVEMSKSPVLEFIEGFVQERPVFNRSELLDGIAEARLTRPGDRELPHLIREIGYDKRKLRPSPGAAPVWLYFPAAMPEDEAKALYQTEF